MGAAPKVGRVCVKCGRKVHAFSFPVRISVRRERFHICEDCSPAYCRRCGVELASASGVKLEVGEVELQRVATGVCERCRGFGVTLFLGAGLALIAAGGYAFLQGSLRPTVGAALAACGAAVVLGGVLGRRGGLGEEDARRLREELEKRTEETEK